MEVVLLKIVFIFTYAEIVLCYEDTQYVSS